MCIRASIAEKLTFSSYDYKLLAMTFKLDLHEARVNKHTKYIGQSYHTVQTQTQTHRTDCSTRTKNSPNRGLRSSSDLDPDLR